jgi:hypothetical protein
MLLPEVDRSVNVVNPPKHTGYDDLKLATGFGYTEIVKILTGPIHPFKVGYTVTGVVSVLGPGLASGPTLLKVEPVPETGIAPPLL